MLKAIVFDVGGTYFQGSYLGFLEKSCKLLGIPLTTVTEGGVIFNTDLHKGTVSAEACFRKLFKTTINSLKMQTILRYWGDTWSPDPKMVKLVHRLKEKYRLALFSNSDLLNSIKYREMGWYEGFDPIILSHELGIIKPEPEIFKILLDKLGLSPQDCLLVDDQVKVTRMGRKLGFQTILFTGAENLERALQILEVL